MLLKNAASPEPQGIVGASAAGAQQLAAEVWTPKPITQTGRLDPLVSPMAGVPAPGGLYGRGEAIR